MLERIVEERKKKKKPQMKIELVSISRERDVNWKLTDVVELNRDNRAILCAAAELQ